MRKYPGAYPWLRNLIGGTGFALKSFEYLECIRINREGVIDRTRFQEVAICCSMIPSPVKGWKFLASERDPGAVKKCRNASHRVEDGPSHQQSIVPSPKTKAPRSDKGIYEKERDYRNQQAWVADRDQAITMAAYARQ